MVRSIWLRHELVSFKKRLVVLDKHIAAIGNVLTEPSAGTGKKQDAAKLYTTKTPIASANLLNGRVLPFFAEQDMEMICILTDRGTEYCGKPESHDYQLYLALNEADSQNHLAGVLPDGIPAQDFIVQSKSFRPICVNGWRITTTSASIKEKCAAVVHRSKL